MRSAHDHYPEGILLHHTLPPHYCELRYAQLPHLLRPPVSPVLPDNFAYAYSLPECGLHRLRQKAVLQSASPPEFPEVSVPSQFHPVIHREQLYSLLLQKHC